MHDLEKNEEKRSVFFFFNKLSKALFLDLCVGSDLAFLSCDTNSELILLMLNGIASFLYWCKSEEKFLCSFPKEVVWFSGSRSYQCLHLGKPLRAVSCRLYSCFSFSAVCFAHFDCARETGSNFLLVGDWEPKNEVRHTVGF